MGVKRNTGKDGKDNGKKVLPKAKMVPTKEKAERGKAPKAAKVKAEEEDSEADVSTSAPSRANSFGSLPSAGWAVMPVRGAAAAEEEPASPAKKKGTARAALRKAEKPKAAGKFSACPVCQKLPDALPAGAWDQYDAKGNPIGHGCRVHMQTFRLGWPHKEESELVELYHSKSEDGKEFRAAVTAASSIMSVMIKKDSLPLILPEAKVQYERSYESELFYEVAFMTESDIGKIWPGLTSKSLKLPKPVAMVLEDGSGTVSGWHLQLWGLDPMIAQCLRRVRVSTKLSVSHLDTLLSGSTQIRPGQGKDVLQLALSGQTRTTAEKAAGRGHVMTFSTLSDRAKEIQAAEEMEEDENGMEDQEQPESEDESAASEEADDDAVEIVPPAAPAFSLGALAESAPAKTKKPPAKRPKLSGPEDEADIADIDDGGDPDEVWQAIQSDTLLMQVAKGLGSATNSLLGLLPAKTFEDGMKVGKQLRGASTLQKKLQGMRSPLAALLESRIVLIERCQVLQHKKLKQVPRGELTSHVEAVQRAKVQLPLRIRLDLLELQVDFAMHDLFEMPQGDFKEVRSRVDAITKKFHWWIPGQPLDELNLTSAAVLQAASDIAETKRLNGVISEDDFAEEEQKAQEVMAECLMEAFGCSAFLVGVGDPAKHRSRLMALLDSFADLANECSAYRAEQDLEDIALGNVLERIGACAKGLLAMANVQRGHKGSTAQHAQKIRSYAGSHLFEATLRDVIASNPAWNRMYDDLVAKGAGSVTHSPELQSLTSKVEGVHMEETSESDAAVVFRTCVERLPVLKRNMRSTACADLEKLLYKQAVLAAREIEKEVKCGLGFFDSVTEVLSMFKDTPGVVQMLTKLDGLKASSMSVLCTKEIATMVDAYPESFGDDIPEQLDSYLKRLMPAMRQIEKVGQPDLHKKMKRVFWWHLRRLNVLFQDLEFTGHQSIILALKELLGKLDPTLEKLGSDGFEAFDKNKIEWMNLSLDGFLSSRELAVALVAFSELDAAAKNKKETYTQLAKVAKAAQVIADRLREVETDLEAITLGEHSVTQWSWLEKMDDRLTCDELRDAFQLREAVLMNEVADAQRAMHVAARGMADPHGDSNWKNGLQNETPLNRVLQASKEDGGLTSIDGAAFAAELTRLEEAIKAARDFQKQTKVLEIMKHRDAWADLNVSEKIMGYGKTLKAEGMLCTTLAQLKPGASSATVKWAKDVLRDVLGDIASNSMMEENVHPALLSESRKLIAKNKDD